MKRFPGVICTFAAICAGLVVTGVFAHKLAWAALMRDYALVTSRQVLFLDKFGSQLPREPQEILRNELAFSLYNLDTAIHSPWNVLIDRQGVAYARNRALVYLSVFPPPLGIKQGMDEINEVFDTYHVTTSQEDVKLLQHTLIAEERIKTILESFEPTSLDADNKAFHTRLRQSAPRQ